MITNLILQDHIQKLADQHANGRVIMTLVRWWLEQPGQQRTTMQMVDALRYVETPHDWISPERATREAIADLRRWGFLRIARLDSIHTCYEINFHKPLDTWI